ncbi:MAG: hypothetical protein UW46_C0004G0048 [Candidatus Yanofskybacteria bacterium GW2011_GWF1_44_227]|uniref:Uncharacterized protein n=1 Tax=Candidatus Yanofskybacteria bacterium GW2011_GWE2_40_11 TaxID=1619033 RepID=A0A0G0QJM6_9BACT|nr:MAG: hypothetical protein UT75_C0007G0022 [Candidatus Yanofskybacteria bacterium GW2011_GWE2_40_11]KKT15630.1 MAG: hypothetical protein UV97_C0004G0046 [Candidatus Yanofskybacteria bacterium GW2011_GWF2_43_596]KKT53321.1 MAG: hypothetical protein UW46_C0004G0048 [Candidatus Yanofskybacteria bacterium GW2011_GWF1_44_227]OGN35951.1 MAG: hypothetical protein A2207_02735 [Candidatus Yanofskybacteria bacterium RIFOXYA1_FULL_44_17]OGN36447.1 MAG: hypothetical protein A2241_01750 [Candidatus Yanofs
MIRRKEVTLESRINDHCSAGEYENALTLGANDPFYLSRIIINAFKDANIGQDMIDRLLGMYIEMMQDRDSWALENRFRYCLIWFDHFSYYLWQRRMMEWLRRFYRIIVLSGLEKDESTVREVRHLIYRFVESARWDDNPREFGLLPGILNGLRKDYRGDDYIIPRLTRTFSSEEEFLFWKLGRVSAISDFDSDVQEEGLVSLNMVSNIFDRIRQVGGNMNRARDIVEAIIKSQLNGWTIVAGRARNQKGAMQALRVSMAMARKLEEYRSRFRE